MKGVITENFPTVALTSVHIISRLQDLNFENKSGISSTNFQLPVTNISSQITK